MAKTAIDASRFDAFLIEPERLTLIDDKRHPLYDPREALPVNEGLVLSMMAAGFHGTMTVWKDGEKIVVLDGRQRTKAAVEANKRLKATGREPIKVRVTLERADEATLFGVQALANENRASTTDMDRAKLLQRLVAFGRTEEEAGAVIGLDKAKTSRVLRLLDCAAPVQRAIEAGKISSSAAAKLASLPREEQAAKLEEVIAAGPTVEKVARAVKKAKGESTVTPPTRRQVKYALLRAEETKEENLADALRWVATGELRGNFKTWFESSDKEPAK